MSFRPENIGEDVVDAAGGAFKRFGGGQALDGDPLRAAILLAASMCAKNGSSQEDIDRDAAVIAQMRPQPRGPLSAGGFQMLLRSVLAAHAAYLDPTVPAAKPPPSLDEIVVTETASAFLGQDGAHPAPPAPQEAEKPKKRKRIETKEEAATAIQVSFPTTF